VIPEAIRDHSISLSLQYKVLYSRLEPGESSMNATPTRQPSAILPVAMSTVALALVLGHVAVYGIVHEADEGTPAHLFQLLMAAQVPIVAFFAIKWLPRDPGPALKVLALQAGAALAAFAAVFFLT
jgi:hypothetical protein